MRKKISTVLEPSLYQSARLEAVRQGRQISEIIAEALQEYLRSQGAPRGVGAVQRSWGILPLEPAAVRQILEEEDSLLDAG